MPYTYGAPRLRDVVGASRGRVRCASRVILKLFTLSSPRRPARLLRDVASRSGTIDLEVQLRRDTVQPACRRAAPQRYDAGRAAMEDSLGDDEEEEVEKIDPATLAPDLYSSCKAGQADSARELLDVFVPPFHTEGETGWTCLHWAARHGLVETVERLIRVNAVSRLSCSPAASSA